MENANSATTAPSTFNTGKVERARACMLMCQGAAIGRLAGVALRRMPASNATASHWTSGITFAVS